jgi:hypothetical protein
MKITSLPLLMAKTNLKTWKEQLPV